MQATTSNNPLREGLDAERTPEPSVLVVFGASGDLTGRKLLPALYSLAHEGHLPAGQAILGVARTPWTDEQFRAEMRRAAEEHSRRAPIREAVWDTFAQGLFYQQGELGEDSLFEAIAERTEEIDRARGTGGRRIYYLAIPPTLFEPTAAMLGKHGLVAQPGEERWTRAIVEKPFGHDLASARELNRAAVSVFGERQLFRIDHYLGKETVQNLLVLRFANGIFEPFWNRQYVDHVQLTVAESIGIGSRGSYFERAGIVRDVVQNHMLQLLALVAMEPPAVFAPDPVRDEKVKVFAALRPFPEGDLSGLALAGQYEAGAINGESVRGYRSEEDVEGDSSTATFAAIKVWIDNWRWAGVPFYLRAGKRLPKRATSISIHFRPAPHALLRGTDGAEPRPNILAIRIQPDEGISLRFDSKVPGPTMRTHPVTMEFRYATSFGADPPEAYERLLLDAMTGDATLFARRDEVEAAWSWLDPLLERWRAGGAAPRGYDAGTWGPPEADELMERDGRAWRRP